MKKKYRKLQRKCCRYYYPADAVSDMYTAASNGSICVFDG